VTNEIIIGALTTWAAIVAGVIFIGFLASGFLLDRFGSYVTHMLSVSMMILMIYALTYLFVAAHQIINVQYLFGIGAAWAVLTFGLELLFGHYALGESWARLRGLYKLKSARLYYIVLVALLAAPYMASLHLGASHTA